ncbi:hypothetical protein F4678DRAFT_464951 [Xylaria arbuscula]|nr:hypothetical protein F4678DRAFT_464951 [Xylaria arbuscula]
MAPTPPTTRRSRRSRRRSRRSRSEAQSSRGATGVVSGHRASKVTHKSGSEAASTPTQLLRPPQAALTYPQPVEVYSAPSWRPAYPQVGQFAMTVEEEVVATGPTGLVFFKRLQDHVSKPWSELRSLPKTRVMLNNQSVSGLAIYSSRWGLNVYCVSGGKLYTFYRSDKHSSFFAENLHVPMLTTLVSGTPTVAYIDGRSKDVDADEYEDMYYDFDGGDGERQERWSLVIPCQSGGLLHTSTAGPEIPAEGIPGDGGWEPVEVVATNLGVISAVSTATTRTEDNYETNINIVAACIVESQLHTVEGPFKDYETFSSWEAQTTARIHHPGEVTGNPVLIKDRKGQLDLLVPFKEGGIFHFVRTMSTPDEWPMIAYIKLPVIGPVACLGFIGTRPDSCKQRQLRAVVQSGGRLYRIKTDEASSPWSGSHIKSIVGPGPSSPQVSPTPRSETIIA